MGASSIYKYADVPGQIAQKHPTVGEGTDVRICWRYGSGSLFICLVVAYVQTFAMSYINRDTERNGKVQQDPEAARKKEGGMVRKGVILDTRFSNLE